MTPEQLQELRGRGVMYCATAERSGHIQLSTYGSSSMRGDQVVEIKTFPGHISMTLGRVYTTAERDALFAYIDELRKRASSRDARGDDWMGSANG